MSYLLVELINATLCKRPLNEKVFVGATDADWNKCFDLALQQQVLAMTFPTMSALPKEQRPGFLLWSKWMAYAQSTTEQSRQKQEALRKMGAWLAEEGLTTLVVKGFSVAVHYPNPNLREFSDIDIFSGSNYEAVNNCLTRHGLTVGKADGHHAHIRIDDVSVEHHFAFGNSRVKGDMYGMETALQQLAATDSRPTAMPGISFPNAAFTTLYVGWHAYKHFLHEKIELRHVVDWALCLKQLSEEEARKVDEVKGTATWSRFADTLTAIALHRLGLPAEWFPSKEVERAEAVAAEEEQRVWNDIIGGHHTHHGRNKSHRRLIIARRLMQNQWKFKEFADESAGRFLWREFAGYVTQNRRQTE